MIDQRPVKQDVDIAVGGTTIPSGCMDPREVKTGEVAEKPRANSPMSTTIRESN